MSMPVDTLILCRLSLVALVLVYLGLPVLAAGQTYDDVVYLKDGSIIRGTIIEQVPGKSIKIQTRDGNVFVYQMDDVEKIAKDPNAAAAAPAATTATAELRSFKGFKFGLSTPGTFWIDDFSFDGDMSYSVGGFYDYALSPKMTGGIELDIDGLSYEAISGTMINIALALKATIGNPDAKTLWRPGFFIGYGYTSIDDLDESAQFFNVGGLLELVFVSEKSLERLGKTTA